MASTSAHSYLVGWTGLRPPATTVGRFPLPASLDGTPASTPRARTLAAWLDAHAVDTGDYTQAQQDADGNLNATLSEQEVELLCEWVDASRDARGPAASTRYMRSLAGALRELWT